MRTVIRRTAIAGCGVLAALAIGGPAASADTTEPTTPSYAPVTLSPEESQHLCAEVLPRLRERTTKLVERINGDANTQGSVAWLRARADSRRAKGRPQVADRLPRTI